MIWAKLFLLSCYTSISNYVSSEYRTYEYETYYFKQKVDHFGFSNQDTYSQRYLLNQASWNKSSGPILFYAGNEGDITLFAQNTGFMWEIAPEFQAMVIFAEHRYYGKSMPYGKHSFDNTTVVGYLTSEQALADFANLLTYVRKSFDDASKSPIIVFGGSYGGMLAAWFRMKYPHIVHGAIAASAPILQFVGMTPCEKFGQLVTKDFADVEPVCANVIRQSWRALDSVFKEPKGPKWINENWRVCRQLKNKEDLKDLKDYLTDVWTNLAMADYPYPASFLAPLPANPVRMVCNSLKNDRDDDRGILTQIFNGLSVYFNYTKTSSCFNYHYASTSQLGEQGWDFQSCTEMVMPFCYDGINDFFEPLKWNFTTISEDCYKKWRVMPRPLMVETFYGGKDIGAASNIVFSNGLLDPWSTGGVMKNISSTVVSVIIPQGAHHLDMRQSDPNDPQSVVDARNFEKYFIHKWIEQYRVEHPLRNLTNDYHSKTLDHIKVKVI